MNRASEQRPVTINTYIWKHILSFNHQCNLKLNEYNFALIGAAGGHQMMQTVKHVVDNAYF